MKNKPGIAEPLKMLNIGESFEFPKINYASVDTTIFRLQKNGKKFSRDTKTKEGILIITRIN